MVSSRGFCGCADLFEAPDKGMDSLKTQEDVISYRYGRGGMVELRCSRWGWMEGKRLRQIHEAVGEK